MKNTIFSHSMSTRRLKLSQGSLKSNNVWRLTWLMYILSLKAHPFVCKSEVDWVISLLKLQPAKQNDNKEEDGCWNAYKPSDALDPSITHD